MTVKELTQALELRSLTMPDPDKACEGVYIGDLLSWVMGRAQYADVWITIMSNINVVAVAALSDVACILLAENVVPEDTVLQTAEAKGINVLTSPKTAYQLAREISQLNLS